MVRKFCDEYVKGRIPRLEETCHSVRQSQMHQQQLRAISITSQSGYRFLF
jgi:hypothetical protein